MKYKTVEIKFRHNGIIVSIPFEKFEDYCRILRYDVKRTHDNNVQAIIYLDKVIIATVKYI